MNYKKIIIIIYNNNKNNKNTQHIKVMTTNQSILTTKHNHI